ncbi:MAG: DUF2155 domain-containing protein [Roseovarius sp.]|uniref:DUF2155 domain-containing protein n=1 Tax=Roseovarius sp. TaxID=1486281 RepID=UPI0032EF9930
MRRALAAALLACFAGLASAQEAAVDIGTGAVLRGLDKVNASVTDIELQSGQSTEYGRLTVTLGECRYPEGDPAADAFAFLTITDTASDTEVFSGWMVASSPALNALEHPRYDVWVLRCKTG